MRKMSEENVVSIDQVNSENRVSQETLISQFLQEMNIIYNDYARRVNIEEWKSLFTSNIFRHIVLERGFYERLCMSLCTNHALPHEIWLLMEEKLSLCAWINTLVNKNLKNKYCHIVYMIQIGKNLNYDIPNFEGLSNDEISSFISLRDEAYYSLTCGYTWRAEACLYNALKQVPHDTETKKLALIYVLRESNLISAAKTYQSLTKQPIVYFDVLKRIKKYIEEYDCLIKKADNIKLFMVITTNILLKIINFDDNKDKSYDVYQELIEYFGEKNMWCQSTIVFDMFDILIDLDKRHIFLKYIDKIVQIEKKNEEALLKEVEELFGFEDDTNILQLYDKKLEFNPNCADNWNRKGDILNSLGQFEKAVACYDEAMQIEPNSVWAYHNKACALESLGQTDDSVSCFAGASLKYIDSIKKLGKLPYAYIFLTSHARNLYTNESYEMALIYLDKALEIEPKKAYIWNRKGQCLSEMGKYEEAIQCFEKACTYELGKDYFYLCNKGRALTSLSQYEEAIKCYNQVLENETTYHRAWYYKARAYDSQKDYLKALENYRQAIFYCDDNFGYIEDMGIVLRELGRYDEALQCFDQVKELMPLFDRKVYYLKATVYFASGEYDKALSNVQNSLDISTDDEEVQQLKEKILEKMVH